MATVTPQQVSQVIAQVMPTIIQGTRLDFFVRRNVTQTQFLMLAAIRGYGKCRMGTLAGNMHVSMPTATGIVGRLVHVGYVSRASDPKDRRQVIVALTQKGETFIREFQDVVRRRWEEVLQPLGAEELAAFHHVMLTLQQQLQPRSRDA